ncbi:MAG: beta-galactosidase [Aliiglaciecola sp.]
MNQVISKKCHGWLTAALLLSVLACSEKEEVPSRVGSSIDDSVELNILLASDPNQIDVNGVSLAKNTDKLEAIFKGKSEYKPALTIKPSGLWDWSNYGEIMISVDITNPISQSAHVFVQVSDTKDVHNRSVVIPSRSSNTYYIALNGSDLNSETGIRSNPPPWESANTPFIWRWGKKQLDLSSIEYIEFSMQGLLADRTLIFNNIKLVSQPKQSEEYLVGLSDQYGQWAKNDFPGKVKSDEELITASQQELASYQDNLPAGRSAYGGWLEGPRQTGTGFFRTEKVGDEWALVDPQGYLFYSFGIANVRMANTSTITGYDFDQSKITQRNVGDLTPEDSLGLNRVPDQALPSRHVASETRANMFNWLPEYSDPLGKHFGYRREVHTGALKRGETFSFYQANLERKYGSDYIAKWRDVTVQRMRNWGFTSFGNWIDPMFYQLNKFPYFANGWIIGDFKTVSSGNDYWSALPDPFDPEFTQRTIATVTAIANEVADNPYCVGVFIDNEKSWGATSSPSSQFGIAIHTLSRDAAESPAKNAFAQAIEQKYQNIEMLNNAWNVKIDKWESFYAGITLNDNFTDAQMEDLSTLMSLYAEEYFKIVSTELKKYMPNHMYMGARFADWGMTPEVVNAAAKYADVMSYNFYKEGMHPAAWTFLADLDKPSIIGEFHMGASDTGLLNPGLVHAESQSERAQMYINYMHSVIDIAHFVGAHWFQYTDSPLTGRAYDGENYNVGFVSVTDTPYPEMVEAVKQVSSVLYQRKFDRLNNEN